MDHDEIGIKCFRYKDMRRETGFEIRSMWFKLGKDFFFHLLPVLRLNFDTNFFFNVVYQANKEQLYSV